MVEFLTFRNKEVESLYLIYVAQLICAFVFARAKGVFSQDEAHFQIFAVNILVNFQLYCVRSVIHMSYNVI